MVAHPLDPLSATEFQSTAAILRRDQGVTDSLAFRFDRAQGAGKGRCQGLETGRRSTKAVAFCLVGSRDQPDVRGGC